MSTTLRLVGRIVEEATPESFIFVTSKEEHPPKFEYVAVKSRERVSGRLEEVYVLAQVVGVVSRSSAFTSRLDLETLERVYSAGIDDSNILCMARTLGFLANEDGRKAVLMPRRALFPGNPVYLAPDELVREFFSYSPDEGLHIGSLVSRPSIPVYLSLNGFRRHVAVIAQTGAGKSYTVGVMLEELLRLGGTAIVIDPHADYVFLSRTRDMRRHEFSDRILIFRNPNSTGRYSPEQLDNVHELVFKFSELDGDEVAEIAGIPEGWANVRSAIREAVKALREEKKAGYTVRDLLEKLERMSRTLDERKKREAASRAYAHLRGLAKFTVFGDRTTPVKDEILRPGHVSILDLSGLNDASQDYIVSRVLEEVFALRSTGQFPSPVFVVIEEAHRFVPSKAAKRKTMSAQIINTIAAEGRKFGVFLILVTQRPSKIDADTLSQCNSQIILRITNPLDQRAVAESSERLGEELMKDLPGLNVGEAIIVGELTRIPVIVKVRERVTREGGADIDLVEELRKTREELGLATPRAPPPPSGSFSEV
ncbi:ATP-binding protein [Infirmifilum lucidum]|uniref:ATP-binding protein n=1 Tax=Infirmifilum lucidum TaxID=2776706 RepID=A0A7L9FFT9_9CREN|nr:ATP-binding protein [Infirmifilum lucidum]QOJ78660.1 ATP-binding protein [Infirmifilum lucidum]